MSDSSSARIGYGVILEHEGDNERVFEEYWIDDPDDLYDCLINEVLDLGLNMCHLGYYEMSDLFIYVPNSYQCALSYENEELKPLSVSLTKDQKEFFKWFEDRGYKLNWWLGSDFG